MMADDRIPRIDLAPGSIPLAPRDGESSGRLEPLAVPVGRFVALLRRHFWVIVAVMIVVIGGTALAVQRMPREYTAEASLVIEPQRTQVSDLQAISPDPGDVGALLRTQIDILHSPTLQRNVAKALDLASYPEFAPKPGGTLFEAKEFLRRLGVLPAEVATELKPDDATEIAAQILGSKMSFANEPRSSVLTLSVTTQSPDLSALIANEMAKQYLDFKRQEKFVAMERARDWFHAQLESLADQVHRAETDVEHYRQVNKLQEQAGDDRAGQAQTVNRQQLDSLSRQLVDVSRDRARKEGQLSQAQAVLRGELPASALPEVLASTPVTQLLAQSAAVAGHEAELAATQGPGNPELAAVKAQLRKLQARTSQEMSNVLGSLGSEVKSARIQEDALKQRMEQLRSAVGTENSAQVELQALQTKVRASRSVYESFLNRATQLANVAGIQQPDASLVSRARAPLGASAPRPARIVGVAALFSLVLGVGLACTIERLRGGFSLPEQMEETLGLPLLAMMPERARPLLRPWRRRGDDAAFSAALDRLRGRMRALGDGRPKVVMVTSALPREGKSVFAAALARNFAGAGWRVMLMECDAGAASIAREFGLPAAPGLCEILAGDTLDGHRGLVHEPEPGLSVIVGGRPRSDPQELMASDRMSGLIAAMRARYDLVVLDTPPVLPVADALVLAQQADSTLMVVRWEKTARAAAQDAVYLLRESRAHVLGAIVTRVDPRIAARAGGRLAYAFARYRGYTARALKG